MVSIQLRYAFNSDRSHPMSRDTTVCMMRIRNEERWIARSLARTFHVCRTVVIWDDASTDGTEAQVRSFLLEHTAEATQPTGLPWGWRYAARQRDGQGDVVVHFLKSPFRPARRAPQEVNEVRDKNVLWEYVKSQIEFRHVLCLDGDEVLSRALLRAWPILVAMLEHNVDAISVPLIYLWDTETQRRIDGWYGDADDRLPRARFLRVFTVDHLREDEVFHLHFADVGTRGGLHCGSVPGAGVLRHWSVGLAPGAIVQLSYIDAGNRARKHAWYNSVDPNNETEGCYAHVIGRPDQHAPGPVRLAPWEDR
jgi:hypothetical protein